MARRMFLMMAGSLTLASVASAAAFVSGNVVVVRVGDGSTALAANTAAPVFLDEYTPTGSLVQSVALPTATAGLNARCTLGGLNTAEGALCLSSNGEYLTLGGYDTAVGTTGIVAATSATIPRVVARVSAAGVVDTTTVIPDGFSAGRIASAVTDDGSRFWAAGAGTGGGVRFCASLGATTSSPIVGNPNNNRVAKIFNGQLYTTISFNGTPNYLGIASVGTGLPTTGSATDSPTTLPGFPATGTHSNFGYFFADANTVFVADDGTVPNSGGLQKWVQSSGTWTQINAPFPYISPTSSPGFRGLTGVVNGSNITLYATSVEGTSNSIIKWESTDSGSNFTGSTLVTVPAGANGNVFRGIAMAPSVSSSVENWSVWN